ncbi:MAG TPA: M23 family metallopeptidase, partial [Candidatus Limnocylindrales bacterium]
AQIASLAAAAVAAGNIPSKYNGTLIWPMGGEISQPFGCTGFIAEPPWVGSPYGYCAHFHQGIDIVAPCMTPIYAADKGDVIWAGYMPAPDGAWDIEIAHAGDLITLYGHMAPEWIVHAGDKVQQGQLIGHESTTGNSTGCHLHWAVYQNGIPVDPRLFT